MKRTKLANEAQVLLKRSMTKKNLKIHYNFQRTITQMNTGTRTHKSSKDYNRQRQKREIANAEE